MLVTKFKNGNVNVKFEPGYDDKKPANEYEFIELLSQNDAFEYIHNYEPCNYGNSCAALQITAYIGGGKNTRLGYYYIHIEDVERYNAGLSVKLVWTESAPYFTIPSFWKTADGKRNGTKGVYFWVDACDMPNDETRELMEWRGCEFLHSHPEYAPEQISDVIFIPYSAGASYC